MRKADPSATTDRGDLALVLTGGGARGAYQVGLMRYLARVYPEMRVPILTGISAGAVNAMHLASHRGSFPEAVSDLVRLWTQLTPDDVFRSDAPSLLGNVARWSWRLLSGGIAGEPQTRGLVDTEPLRGYLGKALNSVKGDLNGIDFNLDRGTLRAVALSSTSYTTGQTVVWVQGRQIETWERPMRRAVQTRINVEHVMASSALPFLFPAIQLGNEWHGDGGIRLTAPLSPALHLGAHKIIAVSTRYDRTRAEADLPAVSGYPPPAQVLGVLYNAIFLDLIDQDVLRLERLNKVLHDLPPDQRGGLREVEILKMRPSQDLGQISREYEPRLPKAFRFMTRGLGTRQTATPDILSLVMFQSDYIQRVIDLGEADAEARAEELHTFLATNNAGLATNNAGEPVLPAIELPGA